MADISLIPKKQKERALPRFSSLKGPRFKFTKFSKVSVTVLILLVVGTIVFFVLGSSLSGEKLAFQEELRGVITERDASLEKKLNDTNILLLSFGDLLKDHRNWSELFKIIEEKTVREIRFISFDGNYEMGIFYIEGVSPNYNILAQQIKSFEEIEGIDEVSVSNIKLNKKGDVVFSAAITFNKKLIKKLPTP